MREIKFRAWNRKRQSMSYDDIYPEASQDWDLWEQSLHCMLHAVEADHVLMQFTGLRDKNNVPVYEGDIVKFETLDVTNNQTLAGVIKYSEHGTKFGVEIEHRGLLQFYPNCTEVIGNVYENPELLKEDLTNG